MKVQDVFLELSDLLPPNAEKRGTVAIVNHVMKRIHGHGQWNFQIKEGNIDVVAEETTGTVAVTQGSATVTGTTTSFAAAHVGRKFRIPTGDNVEYEVSAVGGATDITLTTNYNGADISGAAYTIYQPKYLLASDVLTVLRMWDLTNQKQIEVNGLNDLQSKHFTDLGSGEVIEVALIGRDSSNVKYVTFRPYPTAVARVQYLYYKDYTKATEINDTVDIPAEMDELVKQGTLARWWELKGNAEIAVRENRIFMNMMDEQWRWDKSLADFSGRLGRQDQLDPHSAPSVKIGDAVAAS